MTETKQLLTAAETAGTYSIDPAHTNVGFRVRHMGLAIILGEFTDYTATISCDPNDVTKSSVQFTAIVASLDIKDSVGQTRLGGSAVLNINRLDYGIKWSQILDNGSLVVDNNVQIELQFEAVRQEAKKDAAE